MHFMRRTKADLVDKIAIPARNEYIVRCNLTKTQLDVYTAYLTDALKLFDGRHHDSLPVAYMVVQNLRKICNHPFIFFEHHLKSLTIGERTHYHKEVSHCDVFKHYKWIKESSAKTFKEKCLDHIELSTKLKVLFRFLQQWNGKERVLVFSQTTTMLDVIEEKCKQDAFKYVRLDGQVKDTDRPAVIRTFTESDDVFVFLMTTKVGGLGLNLAAATKVVVFDPDWNPMVDQQATDRALRLKADGGEMHEVMIYRLLVDDTVEEKVYHRQVFKKALATKILSNPRNDKLFDQETMK